MPDDVVHAFVTNENEYGFSLVTPQLPSLVFGRPTEAEFMREYRDAIRAVRKDEGKERTHRLEVVGHYQVRAEAANGSEVVIRYQTGETQADRVVVAEALNRLLASPEEAPPLLAGLQPSATGEYVFVACLADDKLGWLVDQLWADGDALTACLMVADVMVAMTQVASDSALDWPTIAELGWDRNMSIGDLLARSTKDAPVLLRA